MFVLVHSNDSLVKCHPEEDGVPVRVRFLSKFFFPPCVISGLLVRDLHFFKGASCDLKCCANETENKHADI